MQTVDGHDLEKGDQIYLVGANAQIFEVTFDPKEALIGAIFKERRKAAQEAWGIVNNKMGKLCRAQTKLFKLKEKLAREILAR